MDVAGYNLSPIWDGIISIYAEFAEICERFEMRYYASSGTVLGAIRHGGFIPWDDDFDVCMPRPDYERFLQVAKNELPSWLKVVSYRNCRQYYNMFPKIVIADRARVDAICAASRLPAPEGIFIDIFPIDGYPSSRVGRYFRLGYVSLFKALLNKSRCNLFNRLTELFASFVHYDTSCRVTDWAGWRKRELRFIRKRDESWMSPADFGKGIDVTFMGGSVRVPTNYVKYLEWWYGDWRQLPPEENRHPDHTTKFQQKRIWRLGPA